MAVPRWRDTLQQDPEELVYWDVGISYLDSSHHTEWRHLSMCCLTAKNAHTDLQCHANETSPRNFSAGYRWIGLALTRRVAAILQSKDRHLLGQHRSLDAIFQSGYSTHKSL